MAGQVAPKGAGVSVPSRRRAVNSGHREKHGNVPAFVMKEISDLKGRAAVRGQHGFVLRDGGSNARVIMELFSGTTRLSHALAQHLAKMLAPSVWRPMKSCEAQMKM